jgi:hypothetical protein
MVQQAGRGTSRRQFDAIFYETLPFTEAQRDYRSEVEGPLDGTTMMATKLSLASKPTEVRKSLHDTEVRYGAPVPEFFRLKPPPLSKSFGLIFVVTAHHSADGARDPHRAIGLMWRCDEEDGYSRAHGYRPVHETGVDACVTELEWPRSAPRRIRAASRSPRRAGMVRTNHRGASSEALLTLQEMVS